MSNAKTYASKKQQKSLLKVKDLNILKEAPTGCFTFLLPNYSNNKPNFRDFRGKLVKKGKILVNPDCFTAAKVKSDEIISSRYDLFDGVNKFTSGFQFKVCDFPVNVVKVRKIGEKCDLYDGFCEKSCGLLESRFEFDDESRNIDANVRKCSSRCDGIDKAMLESDDRGILLCESRKIDADVRKCSSGCDGIDKAILESDDRGILLCESRNIDADVRKCSSRFDISDGIDEFSTVFEDFTDNSKSSTSHSPKHGSISPHFSLSDLSRDQISRLWLECELDSLNSSINLTLFQKTVDTRFPNDSEARISWREGLANRMFEMDDLDCFRDLSDEGYYSDCCSDTSEICSCPKIADKSLSFEAGPEESSWTVCYKNSLFQA